MENQDKATTGLQVAVTILGKWGVSMASSEQGTTILRVSPEMYARARRRDPEWQVYLDEDQLTRISYVLNIHAALRVIFDNPSNVYSFMSMANHNEGFNGRSPLEVIAEGNIISLRETWLRVNNILAILGVNGCHQSPIQASGVIGKTASIIAIRLTTILSTFSAKGREMRCQGLFREWMPSPLVVQAPWRNQLERPASEEVQGRLKL